MKTEFKIFSGDYTSLENNIKEYQEKHHLEIKNVVLIKNNDVETIVNDVETIVGVIFKKDMVSFFNRKYRNSCKSAMNGFMTPPLPGG